MDRARSHLNDEATWDTILNKEKSSPYYQSIMKHIESDKKEGKIIYPPMSQLHRALDLTPYEQVKVVIIGQDPYHGPNQSNGLAFSVKKGIKIPPSLRNIYAELENDLKIKPAEHGCLESWARQGVLLLNSVLSVQACQPQSHGKIGWQQFTNYIIGSLNQHTQPIVFCLWGSYAQQKETLIDNKKHLILKTTHPSPLSAHRGFHGSSHFSKANRFLKQNNRSSINWEI